MRGGAGVVGDLSVTGNTTVNALTTAGPGQLGSLTVNKDAQVQGALAVAQGARVSGDFGVTGNTQVGTLNSGASTIESLSVGRDATIGGGATVSGDVNVSGALAVNGPARLNKGTTIDGARLTTSTLASPVVEGTATIASLQVTDDGVSTRLAGGLDVSQGTTLRSTLRAGETSLDKLSVTGNIDNTGNLSTAQAQVAGNTNVGGALSVAKGISTDGNLSVSNGCASKMR